MTLLFKTGLLVRPETFEKVWRPHYDRILARAREAKIPIMFHSDGKIDDAIEMLLENGGAWYYSHGSFRNRLQGL